MELDGGVLQAWLDATLPGPPARIEVHRVTGGSSNLLFRVVRADAVYALRMPPVQRNDASADTMARELRLLRALAATRIPHARLIAAHEDPALLGAPFALMQWVDGFTARAPLPTEYSTRAAKRQLSEAMIDALASVTHVDWQGLGLGDFGRPDGFLERQVERWRRQFTRAATRELPLVERIGAWLQHNRPVMRRAALIHGDYTFLNVMFQPGLPPRVVAIVDWELATIGDPLLDLGWLLGCWERPGELPSHASYFEWSDMPDREELAQRYARLTGLDVSALAFYMVLGLFKFAAIMEGWYAAYKSGRSSLATHASMETVVPHILARAAMFAESSEGRL